MVFVRRNWGNNATECAPFLFLTFLGFPSAVSQHCVAQQRTPVRSRLIRLTLTIAVSLDRVPSYGPNEINVCAVVDRQLNMDKQITELRQKMDNLNAVQTDSAMATPIAASLFEDQLKPVLLVLGLVLGLVLCLSTKNGVLVLVLGLVR